MNKWVFCVLTLCFLLTASAVEVNGKWKIVLDAKSSLQEQVAASELQKYLEKVTGKKLPIVRRGAPALIVRGNPALYIEEWQIKHQKDGNILISGGMPRGVIFAVMEFLERGVGCRFLAPDYDYIPKKTSIQLPDHFEFKGRPYFDKHDFGWGTNINLSGHMSMFRVKRKSNAFMTSPRLGSFERDAFHVHTYYLYTKDLPKEDEDCLSLTKDGKRLYPRSSSGPGQLCFSNPKTLKLVTRKFEEITSSHIAWMQTNGDYKGTPIPTVWAFSQNDTPAYCHCKGCKALYKKYDGVSGAMLYLTNKLAEEVEKKHPEYYLQAEAYQHTEKPPKGIKARKNVIIRLCQLGAEWGQHLRRDSVRSINHPLNAAAKKNIEEWAAVSENLAIYDYWNVYSMSYSCPMTNIYPLADTIKYYAKLGKIKRFYAENGIFRGNSDVHGNFKDLRNYLGMKLLVDPTLDTNQVIDEFMTLYYGPAAKPMKELLDHISNAMDQQKSNISFHGVNNKYLNKEFFLQSEKILAAAEKAAAGNKDILARIGQERIPYDITMLIRGERIGFPIDFAKLEKRLTENCVRAVKKYISYQQKEAIENTLKFIKVSALRLPVPEQFKGRKVFCDMTWNKFSAESSGWTDMIEDPEAAGGKARIHTGISPRIGVLKLQTPDYHKRGMLFKLFDPNSAKRLQAEVRLTREQLPKDGKYHWYKVGVTPVNPFTAIHIHDFEHIQINFGSAADINRPGQKCEIWVSIKLRGPSYVPGSKEQDAILVDRIMMLEK